MTCAEIAKLIDHALLHPTLTDKELEAGCRLAAKYQTASVCVKPYALRNAADWLRNSGVMVTTVIGFPHGSNTILQKYQESEQAIEDGAVELDMVVNIGKVLSEDWEYVTEEINTIQQLVTEKNITLKVIFETDFLSNEHKIKLCGISSESNVGFVKTSTGFGFVKHSDGNFRTVGATAEDIKLMRKYSDPQVEVKASGGIRTLNDLLMMVECGATRIGTGSTQAIMEEALSTGNGGPGIIRNDDKNAY